MGSARCSPIPMFPSPHVSQSLCSPLYDISPYVSHIPQSLCYPEMFPSPVAPQTYTTQSLCSPVPMFHIFRSPYVLQSLCSPVHLFPSPYRCSPVPMLPSPYVPPTNSSVPISTPIPQKIPFPIFPKHVPQSLSSPVPMFPKHVPQSLCSPVHMFHKHVPQSLYHTGKTDEGHCSGLHPIWRTCIASEQNRFR